MGALYAVSLPVSGWLVWESRHSRRDAQLVEAGVAQHTTTYA